jgi:hypothetical protein
MNYAQRLVLIVPSVLVVSQPAHAECIVVKYRDLRGLALDVKSSIWIQG